LRWLFFQKDFWYKPVAPLIFAGNKKTPILCLTSICAPFPFILLLFTCCQSGNKSTDAQKIVDRAIETHGGKAFEQAHIQFDFLDRTYIYIKVRMESLNIAAFLPIVAVGRLQIF
jgi:hypothetical protein